MWVKDRVTLAPMAIVELCTDIMSSSMGPDKPSSFCNYYVEPHVPASCGAFSFGGRMRPRAKTSSLDQGPDFDLVGTCEWLSYVRASGSLESDSSPAGCISIRIAVTLSVMSGSLSLQSSRSMFDVLLVDLRSWIWMIIIIYSHYFTYLPLMLAWINVLLVYACSSCRCKPNT
jgi:hypothetical protein